MSQVDFGLLVNSETCKYHLTQFQQLDASKWAIYIDTPTYFLQWQHKHRAALLHWPYPKTAEFNNVIEQIYDHCHLIVITISELHESSYEFIRKFDREKIVFFVAGFVDFPLQHARIEQYMDWFETSRHFYRDYLPEVLGRLQTGHKENSFDILLGRKKPHRDHVHNFVKQNMPVEQYFMTYFDKVDIDFPEEEILWAWEQPGLKFSQRPKWTVDMVEYFGHRMSISQVIPIDIYNRTAYSVIAETNYSNHYTFFTEKTAKPIIAKRLFIMIAGCGYLAKLRSLGFKTFDGIIDESYDTVEDNKTRWQLACEQMQVLAQQPQDVVQQKIQPIVDHNFNVMMNKGWYKDFNAELEVTFSKLLQQT